MHARGLPSPRTCGGRAQYPCYGTCLADNIFEIQFETISLAGTRTLYKDLPHGQPLR